MMERLGEAYLSGHDTEIDYKEAEKWFLKAIEGGNTRSYTNLGIMYLNGNGVKQDYKKATELFKKGTEAGDMKAPRYMGIIYEKGFGVEQNYEKAAEYYHIGDKRGDLTSQYNLGKLYEKGLGVSQDYKKAMELYLKIGDRLDHVTTPSVVAIGDLYLNRNGVERNVEEAKNWYTKAADAGNEEAKKKLENLK